MTVRQKGFHVTRWKGWGVDGPFVSHLFVYLPRSQPNGPSTSNPNPSSTLLVSLHRLTLLPSVSYARPRDTEGE